MPLIDLAFNRIIVIVISTEIETCPSSECVSNDLVCFNAPVCLGMFSLCLVCVW